MELSKGEKIIKNTSGLLGIFQGLIWTGLSLTCIVIYLSQMDQNINIPPTTPIHRTIIMMHAFFLYDVSPPYYRMFDGQIITSKVFDIFMWNYCILDIIWVVSSLCIIVRNRNDSKLRSSLKFWGGITLIVCALDLIFVVLLGTDYNTCIRRDMGEFSVMGENCVNGILPVLVIAAKGFVLWFINLVFAIMLLKMASQLSLKRFRISKHNSSHLNGGACACVCVPKQLKVEED